MQVFAFEGCDSGCSVYCGALSLESAKAASVRKAAKLGGIIPDFGQKVNKKGVRGQGSGVRGLGIYY